ncbi:unnamed protein product, partial [Menidia menidia]
MVQASGPVDRNICLLFVQLHSTGWSNEKKLDVIVTVILGHLLSAGFVWTLQQRGQFRSSDTQSKAIVEQQVVCHADSVGLHGVALTIVIISNITWRENEKNRA